MKTLIHPGEFASKIDSRLAEADEINLIKRIWEKDHSLWSDSPKEISNRLGWLDISIRMEKTLGEINDFVENARDEFDTALLLGMGGSSLAPDVFSNIFGEKYGYLKLKVLDSTHPDFVNRISSSIDLKKTLFVVSTKSGGTAETMSLMKYFYNKCKLSFGGNAGNNFTAITDQGSALEHLANELKFRKIFLNDPNIGGRFSALSYFGIVPASLIGVDVRRLLENTNAAICSPLDSGCLTVRENDPAVAGIALGEFAAAGRNKLTFITSESLANFGDWVEQLIAESTGKMGKGILPVVGENEEYFNYFGKDRVVVFIKIHSDNNMNYAIDSVRSKGFPVIVQELENIYELGTLIYFWEFATAVAGWIMKIQPFDQPNVESAKNAARRLMAEYSESGELPALSYDWQDERMKVNSTSGGTNLSESAANFFSELNKHENPYIAIQCYSDYDPEITARLFELRKTITAKYGVPVTIGFGPRFLHSTGQLHKGDDGSGLFLQIFQEPSVSVDIPDEPGSGESSVSFNILVRAQSLGDRKALIDNKRSVLRIDSENAAATLNELAKFIN